MNVAIRKLSEDAKSPSYSYEGDAGLDLCAAEAVDFAPGERHGVKTGLAIEIPIGYVGLIWDRSSIGITRGLKTLGGVIDAGYRGEILVGIVNLSGEPVSIAPGEKIAQILIQPVERVDIIEADVLSESERAERGLGSSGNQ